MQMTYKQEAYAGFFVRLAAYLIDMAVVGFVLAFLKIPVWCARLFLGKTFLFQDILFRFDLFDIIFYLMTVAYFVAGTYLYGATLGKHLMKLKVVNVEGERLTLPMAIFRETVGRYLSGIVLYFGYFMIGVDRKKQGLHDRLADTFVVYRDSFAERKEEEKEEWTNLND